MHAETWDEHIRRVRWTIDQVNIALSHIVVPIVADLSCGDGMILRELAVQQKIFGDIMWGPHIDVLGPIEETIKTTMMDMLICAETLEYVLDPAKLLQQIRMRTRYAVLTSSLGGSFWDKDQFECVLHQNTLLPRQFAVLEDGRRTLQLWVVQSAERHCVVESSHELSSPVRGHSDT